MYQNYVLAALSYGIVRSIYKTHHAKLHVLNRVEKIEETRPMMLTERACAIALGTAICLGGAPLFLAKDLADAELALRGRYAAERGQPKHKSIMSPILD